MTTAKDIAELAATLKPSRTDPTGEQRAAAMLSPKSFEEAVGTAEQIEMVDALNRIVARIILKRHAVAMVAQLVHPNAEEYAQGRLVAMDEALDFIADVASDMGVTLIED